MNECSRRNFLYLAGAGALAGAAAQDLRAQAEIPPPVPAPSIYPYESRSPVALVKGDDRRKNVIEALTAVDREIAPVLKRKKYVAIKINNVRGTNQLCATHVDALRGILDYLEGRFRGLVVIADSSKDNTWDAYENFHYDRVLAEYRRAHVRFVDFNEEEKYVVQEIVDRNHHLMQVRLAARLFDPDAFILGAALLKAHDNVVATLSVKNLVMAAPLHSTRKEITAWHDKSKYHQGYREI